MTEVGPTAELIERLRRHYIRDINKPGGVFVAECGINGTFGASQRCDALYAGFTNQSGRTLIGHEVKVSRADWVHEMDKPHKADRFVDSCHEWFLVVLDPAIVREGELPNGWGLMAPDPKARTRMRILVRPIRTTVTPDWDVVRSMMARADTLAADRRYTFERELAAEFHEKVQAMRAEFEEKGLNARGENEQLIAKVLAAIRAASPNWRPYPQPEDIAAAAMDLDEARRAGRQLRDEVKSRIRELRAAIDDVRGAYGPLSKILTEMDTGS